MSNIQSVPMSKQDTLEHYGFQLEQSNRENRINKRVEDHILGMQDMDEGAELVLSQIFPRKDFSSLSQSVFDSYHALPFFAELLSEVSIENGKVKDSDKDKALEIVGNLLLAARKDMYEYFRD